MPGYEIALSVQFWSFHFYPERHEAFLEIRSAAVLIHSTNDQVDSG